MDKKQHSALDLAVLSGSVPAVRALKIYARLLEETYMFFIKTFEKKCGDVSTGEIVRHVTAKIGSYTPPKLNIYHSTNHPTGRDTKQKKSTPVPLTTARSVQLCTWQPNGIMQKS